MATAGQDGKTVRTSVFDQSKRTTLPVIFRLDDVSLRRVRWRPETR